MEALGISDTGLTPDEVIRAILQSPVDLLWNGGIGTYVKASTETNEDAGDRVNDPLRVDGSDLRCKVVGEGGNLGLSQPGRIEYAANGGRVNTDFIDNSGGVHCSDREVNLKVLLGLAEARGELARDDRDELVLEVVEDVVAAIIYDNFLQAQILAQEVEGSARRLEAYEDLMSLLEAEGTLDRAIEHLPTTEEMSERARSEVGMSTPELCVLLAYSKRSLRRWLLDSDLPDWPDFAGVARRYFPPGVVARFGHLITDHPLRRELIATSVANGVVNSAGITLVIRLMTETGAAAEQVVRAYTIAREVTDAPANWEAVEALVGRLPAGLERTLLGGIDDLVESVARWYLTNPGTELMGEVITKAEPVFVELAKTIAEYGPIQWRNERDAAVAHWIERGVPSAVAHRHVYQEELIHAPDIIEVIRHAGRPVREVAEMFFLAGAAFEIDWLESQVGGLPAGTRWQRRAVQTIEDDLVVLRRQLVEGIFAEAVAGDNAQEALQSYLVARTHELGRLTRFMRSLAVDGVSDVSPVIVAIRQIRNLAT
jgi:glutamate dehydrogenase